MQEGCNCNYSTPETRPSLPLPVHDARREKKTAARRTSMDNYEVPLRQAPVLSLTTLYDSESEEADDTSKSDESGADFLLSPRKNGPDFSLGRLPWWEMHVPMTTYDFSKVTSNDDEKYIMDLFYQSLFFKAKRTIRSPPVELKIKWEEFTEKIDAMGQPLVEREIRLMREGFMKEELIGKMMTTHQLCKERGQPCNAAAKMNRDQSLSAHAEDTNEQQKRILPTFVCPMCYDGDETSDNVFMMLY